MLHSGLGFEPILSSSGRHVSVRFGPRPVVQVPYPEALMGNPWPGRALELNHYLLGGSTQWHACQYRQGGLHFPEKFAVSQVQLSRHDLVRVIVDEAVSVRVCQLFVDGNHCTAILSIYEKLSDAGWWLDMSAIDLYILISSRNKHCGSMVKVRMVKVSLRHLKHEPDIHVHARQIYAGQVKLIARSTLFLKRYRLSCSPRDLEGVKAHETASFSQALKEVACPVYFFVWTPTNQVMSG